MVGSEVVLALVTLPGNDRRQSVVYLRGENRVEMRDEILTEASPQDVLPVLLEKTKGTTPNGDQLPLFDKSNEQLIIERIPVKELRLDENLDVFDGNKKVGGLINSKQRQRWLGSASRQFSDVFKSAKPGDEIVVLHSGDGLVYRLLLPARASQGSSDTTSKRSKKGSSSKKSSGAGVPVELLSAAQSWISALSKEACEKAIASQMDMVIQNLRDVFEKTLDDALMSYMHHQNELRQELDRKKQEINSLKILVKDLEHNQRITQDIAISKVSSNLERASLILRGYSDPAQDALMPGERLRRLLKPSEHYPDDLTKEEGISNFMDEADRMYTDLRELVEIFVEQKMMTARKGENDEQSDIRD